MCSIRFRSGDILGHSITFTFISKAVVILVVCLGWLLCCKTISEGRASSSSSECHSTCWNPCFPQWSHAAPDHDATTTMLDCRQGTIFLVLLTRASPHMLDTIWVKQVYLRLIRPQDMVPVIHALARLSSANCLQAFLWASFRRGFLLGWRPCKPTCCSVWRMVWALTSWPSTSATSKAMLATLMRLFFEASFCTWRTAQGLNFFDRPLRGLFRVKPILENLFLYFLLPRPSLWRATILILKSSESSLPWGAMLNIQWSVWEIVLQEPNLNCSKTRYTNLYGPVKQIKTWTWWIGHVALHV